MGADVGLAAGMEAQLAAWRKRLVAGERRIGWKIALNVPAVQRRLGISAPVIGYLTSATVIDSSQPHSLEGATRPAVEPEIAVRLGAAVRGAAEERAAAEAIAALAPAIEVIDVNRPFEDLTTILAENVFHRGFALGTERRDVTAEGLGGGAAVVSRNGAEAARADVGGPGRALPGIVRHVAGLLERFGERLEAGDVIIAGSLTAAVPVEAGDAMRAGVGPLGQVELRF